MQRGRNSSRKKTSSLDRRRESGPPLSPSSAVVNNTEVMNRWKLQLTSEGRNSSSRSKSGSDARRSGLVLSAVSDVLRRDRAGDHHVQVSYPTHSMLETCSLLVSRYNAFMAVYMSHLEKERSFQEANTVELARAALRQTDQKLKEASDTLTTVRQRWLERKLALQALRCQEEGFDASLKLIRQAKQERLALLEMVLKRLEGQGEYLEDIWGQIRERSPVSCVLAEQLEERGEQMRREGISSEEGLTNLSAPQMPISSALTVVARCIAEGLSSKALALLSAVPQEVLEEDDNLLHYACAVPAPSLDVVRYIVQRRPELCKGVDTASGNTALHLACAAQRPDERVVQVLLEAGVPPGTRNNLGYTAFHVAVTNLNDGVQHRVRTALLRSGKVYVDERTTEGLTSLHLVCGDDRYLNTSAYLVRCGAALWALATHRLHYPPYTVRKITPAEKSRTCFAVQTYELLRDAMKSAHKKYF